MTHLTRESLLAWRDAPSDADRPRIVGHLAACDACAGLYAELMRTHADLSQGSHFDPQAFVDHGHAALKPRARVLSFRRHWWMPLAAAAAVMVAVWLPGRDRAAEVIPTTTVRGSELRAVAPSGSVGGPLEFRWTSASTPDRFAVEITDASGRRVFYRETRDARLTMDPAMDSVLRLGQPFTWTVAALDAAGEVIMRSQPASFVRDAGR